MDSGLVQRTEDRGQLTVKDDFSPLHYGKSLIYRKVFVYENKVNASEKLNNLLLNMKKEMQACYII